MNKIIIFGAGGQLGKELLTHYPQAIGFFHSDLSGKPTIDISDGILLSNVIRNNKPDIVINAAAIANVDFCERNHQLAYSINGEAPGLMSRICNEIGAKLIHISTDYVFDGVQGNYTESSIPNPVNYYGLSKLLGDAKVLSYDNSLVIRTSGVFGFSKNFPMHVLNSLKERIRVNTIPGFYSPIHVSNLSNALLEIVEKDRTGLINIAGERISRHAFALKIAEHFSLDDSLIQSVENIDEMYARRPFDSSLDSSKALSILSSKFNTIDSNIFAMKKSLSNKNDRI